MRHIINTVRKTLTKSEVWIPIVISFAGLIINYINTQNAIRAAGPNILITEVPANINLLVAVCKTPYSLQSSPELQMTLKAELTMYVANNGALPATLKTDVIGLSREWIREVTDEDGKPISFPRQFKSNDAQRWRFRITNFQRINSHEEANEEYSKLQKALDYKSPNDKRIEWRVIVNESDPKILPTTVKLEILRWTPSESCGDTGP